MKYLLLFLPVFVYSQTVIYGLDFPSNGDAPADSFIAFQFDDPQNNGLPIWGPDNNGATWIWEIKPVQQTGYYVTWWWANDGTVNWHNGNTNTYIGAHPYPRGYYEGTVHDWELAGGSGEMWPAESGCSGGGDYIETEEGGGHTKLVIKNQWYTQAVRIHYNQDDTKWNTFFVSLPDTVDSLRIENNAIACWGDTNPPNPAIIWGDSPWCKDGACVDWATERLSGILGRIKVIDTVMTGADILAEAADMTQLVTAVAQRNIWWGITSFEHVDSLRCDYGTGRIFYWAGTQKASITPIDTIWSPDPDPPISEGGGGEINTGGTGRIQ